MKIVISILIFISFSYSNSLQKAINKAKPYSTIKLSSGIYNGNIIINKPLTILGKDSNVIIKGEQKNSVVTINSSNVILKNLTITNSGNMMTSIDAGISINNSSNCTIQNCKIIDNLYGIDMNIVNNSKIINNFINSKDIDITLRGNALKLYYANNNIFNNNTINNSRDITLNYSNNNKFANNRFTNNRFATHIQNSHNNILKHNTYKHNSVAIMVMGAKDMIVSNNKILSSKGAAGIGIVISGVSNFVLDHNILKFNAKAIYIDGGEKAKGMKRYITNNTISYNKEAIHFHQTIKDNTITNNIFDNNIDDIVKDLAGYYSNTNIIQYNYWSYYTGFDSNKDNIGNTTHRIYQYADQLWHYNPKVKFFYASPIMSLLNFLGQLAPFIEPSLLIEDTKPLMFKK